MKPSRLLIHRLSLLSASLLAVLLITSMFVVIIICPWLCFGAGCAAVAQFKMEGDWFELETLSEDWDSRLAYLIGFSDPWIQYMNGPWVGPGYVAVIPLLYPTLALFGLAWFTWPRRIKPGHCQCGYNLTGNTSGRCPECGAPIHEGS